jgi:CheY-like chemotaxis protein
MKDVRILIVEDEQALLEKLASVFGSVFGTRGYAPIIEKVATVERARQLAKDAKANPYDFVSLDVNLGDATLTGLDVLDTLKRFKSAWMVALLTGVETDASLDETMGKARGEVLRRQLRRDAYARFPGDRLIVVEKPASIMTVDEAQRLLENRLEQIALLYEDIGRLRYVFRPIEVSGLERINAPRGAKARRRFAETTALHWQIRFNCGEIRTLPDMAGFRTFHYLLSRNPTEEVTPEEALAYEPKSDRGRSEAPDIGPDPVAGYFEAQGIAWAGLSSAEQEKLVRAALSLKFNRYNDLRGYQDEDDLSPAEEDELARIVGELGPLCDAAETAYQRLRPNEDHRAGSGTLTPAEIRQNDLHIGGANYDRLGTGRRGLDSPAAQLFRARMKRVKDCLRENGFADFAEHIESCLHSTGANWSYNPPGGIEWTT